MNTTGQSLNSGQSQHIISELQQIIADLQSKVVSTQDTLQKLNQAVETAPLSITITDRDGLIEYVNPHFTNLTGYEAEEVIGNTQQLLDSGLTSAETFDQMKQVVLSGGSWSGEFFYRKKNGELIKEAVWTTPVLDERGAIQHFVFIGEDITHLRQAENSLAQSNQTLYAMHNVLLEIGAASQAARLLHQIIDSAIDLLRADQGGAIYLYEEKKGKLLLVEGIGISEPQIGSLVEPDVSLAGRIFQRGEAVLVENYRAWEDGLVPDSEKRPGSAIGVPLKINTHGIGVLMLYAGPNRQSFTKDELGIASMFAAQAVIAYQRVLSFERLESELAERKKLERQERELRNMAQTMFDITALLNASLKVEEVLDTMVANIGRVVPGDMVCLFLVAGATARSVRSQANVHELAEFLKTWEFNYAMDPFFLQMVMEEQPIVVGSARRESIILPEPFKSVISLVSSPVIARGELIGLILVGSHLVDAYTRENARNLKTFSNQAALAVHNARLYEEVQNLAITDPLTGVYNRRGFLRYGRLEINRAMRFGRSLSMLFFDIDHFKAFNDRYSYDIGDQVLQNVAQVAQATVRNVDLVGRYGGEEFVILIPEVTQQAAVVIAERLRARVEALKIQSAHGDLGVTISVGVASITFPRFQTKPLDINEEDILERLVQRAGYFLHLAKERGRNQVGVEQN